MGLPMVGTWVTEYVIKTEIFTKAQFFKPKQSMLRAKIDPKIFITVLFCSVVYIRVEYIAVQCMIGS